MVNNILDKYNTTMRLTHAEWQTLLAEYNLTAKNRMPNGSVTCGACKTKITKYLNARRDNGTV